MQFRMATGLFLALAIITSMQMLARSVFTILLSHIAGELRLSDTSLGVLQGPASLLIPSVLAMGAVWAMRRQSHAALLTSMSILWIVAVCGCAFSVSGLMLVAARSLMACAEFMMVPVVYSWLPILANGRSNLDLNLAYGALVALGASAGYVVGPLLVEAVAAWQNLFHHIGLAPWRIVMAAIALLPGSLTLMWTSRIKVQSGHDAPARSHATKHVGESAASAGFELPFFFVAAGLLSFSVQGTEALLPVALLRRYHLTTAHIGLALGSSVFLTSIASLAAAWLLDRAIGRGTLIGRYGIMISGIVIAVPLSHAIMEAATLNRVVALNLTYLLSTCIANALVPTILQDLAAPSRYKSVFATYSLTTCAFSSLGPVLAGWGSQHIYGGDLLAAIRMVSMLALTLAAIILLYNVLRQAYARRQRAALGGI